MAQVAMTRYSFPLTGGMGSSQKGMDIFFCGKNTYPRPIYNT